MRLDVYIRHSAHTRDIPRCQAHYPGRNIPEESPHWARHREVEGEQVIDAYREDVRDIVLVYTAILRMCLARYVATPGTCIQLLRAPLTETVGTLLAMLGRWVAIGSPHYPWFNTGQTIAYISDIGATGWGKPLFIAGSAVSVVTFDLVFVAERWLRHRGRLTRNYNLTEKILSTCATIAAVVGAAGLILLTIFDTRRYPHVHDAMLVVFM